MLVPQDQMLLTSAKFKSSCVCFLSSSSTGREIGVKGIAILVHLFIYCSISATGVCKAGGRGKEAGVPASCPKPQCTFWMAMLGMRYPWGYRASHPPGYSEAEKAVKFILQVICLKLYVFLTVSLPSVMHSRHCREMS